jgi:hypothetical protein
MLDKDAEYLTTNNQDDIQDVLMMLGCGAGVNDSDQAHTTSDQEASQW